MNIFFSHSTADAGVVQQIVNVLCDDNVKPFYSSNPESGIMGGEGIMSRINQAITGCDLFVPVITENYVRSLYCVYELSVAAFQQEQKKLRIIPIAANRELPERVNAILQQFDLRYIYAVEQESPQIFSQTFSWVRESKLPQIQSIMESLAGQVACAKPYIGMPAGVYTGILKYCEDYGIKQIKSTTLPTELLKAKVSQAKEVILLSTTGAALLKNLCASAIPTALANGCKISVLVPNQHSQFCADVAEIERPDAIEQNLERLDNEFHSVTVYLKDAWRDAYRACQGNPPGNITCYCSHTLLRQTVLLVKNPDESVWAWVSLTMPPKRTVDGTPSFEAEGNLEPGQMVYLLWQHCTEIMGLSRRRGSWFSVNSDKTGPFFLEKKHAREYWEAKFSVAKNNMMSHRELYEQVLIEVAAQHPLKKRKLPGTEFAARLDAAVEIGAKYEEMGIEVMYYVPGSCHCYHGVTDQISLSKAGCEYLLRKGIPQAQILGEDANVQYKGEEGVYNSADECYVASRIFLEGEYDRLVCVCAPNQVMRKTLFYIEFGVLPQCYSVPVDDMFHNVLDEALESIEYVLFEDHSWQNRQGEAFLNSRKERMPQD